MKKYNLFFRLFVVVPVLLFMSIIWSLIAIASTESLGKVLKQTGENLLKP